MITGYVAVDIVIITNKGSVIKRTLSLPVKNLECMQWQRMDI